MERQLGDEGAGIERPACDGKADWTEGEANRRFIVTSLMRQ